ncbi:Methylated-DNA--protein-cysteine methyltransferase [Porphyromonas levii]|uniref:methylated-DNA--[protein]-cysteine S-methyltransferase n=1 Tax=Porphyromonas levii TaxID=28114 RepID=UPI001B8AA13F|nr:methylated-DNA--[protein]-cysteine S-methyltransferase [Porphyromonas levii]MBR8703545.1 Methylated-DNA--protein-cysteine methyltransferase [Porphyromonas levii]MBR8729675.1 Methylated-DNA--protein-cysteine methyltransferase [Porphyromonas levii]MBR8731923.1 Methylated-DNA--protein-cysteine methyltransferase [Porphyromonas levii]MBR8759768.1 Methylated-DNA--protein-cysteine methyltransferase [Porphyromonas levii]MBR8769834.1 Methylated-DNA--protein-cysteine methyltransferase [Porphyromonas 
MGNYYFNTPIGIVECEISYEQVITKCYPIDNVNNEALASSRRLHPELAEAFAFLLLCPKEYTALGGRVPSFAPDFWAQLARVPFGTTLTYGAFAQKLGLSKRYARVVGNILGSNECFFLLPCHRIVPANGGVGGFRWGTEVKRKLLAYESATKEE